jgi:hypothetical protein
MIEVQKPKVRSAGVEREPLRDELRPDAPRKWTMTARSNWDDVDLDREEQPNRLHIDKSEVPEGMDMRWVTAEVFGKSFADWRSDAEKRGWTPVHQQDFDGQFDGRFMPKGRTGEIVVDGLVLCARPMELSKRSKIKEMLAAGTPMEDVRKKLHGGLDVPGGDHASARDFNHIKSNVERIAIPGD